MIGEERERGVNGNLILMGALCERILYWPIELGRSPYYDMIMFTKTKKTHTATTGMDLNQWTLLVSAFPTKFINLIY